MNGLNTIIILEANFQQAFRILPDYFLFSKPQPNDSIMIRLEKRGESEFQPPINSKKIISGADLDTMMDLANEHDNGNDSASEQLQTLALEYLKTSDKPSF